MAVSKVAQYINTENVKCYSLCPHLPLAWSFPFALVYSTISGISDRIVFKNSQPILR
jgi:hypothetical protein